MKKGFKRSVLCAAVLALSHARPALSRSFFPAFPTPYGPRITGQGFLSDDKESSAFIDGMLPFYGDRYSIVFLDGSFMQSRGRSNASSMGGGTRLQFDTRFGRMILGGYTMGEFLTTSEGKNAWVINPGLEILTVNQEAHLHAYIPVGSTDKIFSSSVASNIPQNAIDDTGIPGPDLVRAAGNDFLDTPVSLTQEIPTGGEIEYGQKFKGNIWARAGGYYFHFNRARLIEGGFFNVDIPLSVPGAHLLVMDSYDTRRHNLFSLGIRYNYGDTGLNRQGLDARMTETLNRHLNSIQVGSAVPTRYSYKRAGASTITQNVFYFSPNGEDPAGRVYQPGVCTAENPCRTFDQAAVDGIEDNVANDDNHYFMANGAYNTGGAILTLVREGGSAQAWGFSNDNFNQQATGANRPDINGAIFWGDAQVVGGDEANGVLKNLQIDNFNLVVPGLQSGRVGDADANIAVGATNNITVDNSVLEVENTETNDAIGVFAGNNITVSSSSVDSRTSLNVEDNDAFAIYALNDAIVSDSTLTANETGNGDNNYAAGIIAFRNATVTNTDILARASGGGGNNDSFGVFAINGTATITGGELDVYVSGVGAGSSAYAVISDGDAEVSNATLYATVFGDAIGDDNNATGVRSTAGNVLVTDSTVVASSEGDENSNDAFGAISDAGNIIIDNSTITANTEAPGDANHAYAVRALVGTTTIRNNSVISATVTADAVGDGNQADGVISASTTISDSTVTASVSAEGNLNRARAVNVTADSTVTNSTLNATVTGDGDNNDVYGLRVEAGNVIVDSTNINVTMGANHVGAVVTGNDGIGIATLGVGSQVTVQNGSQITVQSSGAGDEVTTFGVSSAGTIIVDNSTVSATNTATAAGDNNDVITLRAVGNITVRNGAIINATNNSLGDANSATGVNSDADVTVNDGTITATVADAADGGANLAVGVFADGTIDITDGSITATNNSDGTGNVADAVLSDGNITVTDSMISASSTGNGDNAEARGLSSTTGAVTVTGTQITASSSNTGTNTSSEARGIYAETNAIITNSTITVTSSVTGNNNGAVGVHANTGYATVTNSTVTATAQGGDGDDKVAVGVEAETAVTIQNGSTITANTSSDGEGNDAIGVRTFNGGVTVTDSTIAANATAAANTETEAVAILSTNGVTMTGSTVSASQTGANGVENDAIGIYASGGNVDISSSTITVNSTNNRAFGVRAAAGTIDFTDSSLDVIGDYRAFGLLASDLGGATDDITIDGSDITVTAGDDVGDEATGIVGDNVTFEGDQSTVDTNQQGGADGDAIDAQTAINNDSTPASTCNDGGVCN